MSMHARQNNVIIRPDLLPEKINGIVFSSASPSHRTGTIVSVGPEVTWHLPKEERRVLYRQRNCVDTDELHIITTDAILMEVAEDVFFNYEEQTPENKTKIHLKKHGTT